MDGTKKKNGEFRIVRTRNIFFRTITMDLRRAMSNWLNVTDS